MSVEKFTHTSSTFRPQALISVILAFYCCLVVTLLTPNGSSRMLTLAQTIRTNTGVPVPAATTSSSATTVKSLVHNSNNNTQIQQQPKSLKFTLIAGKVWRFNIKANSFTSHKEGELRLHKNVSINNYIIDDDGWFQYNPQQQQLLAWPSLSTKPGTYHFVLLPSGVDFEADSENIVSLEVAANIVVELIRPLYQGVTSDIDQFIDYKFSLDYLHRHTSYPLLLNQIVSVFDTLSRTTLSSPSNNSTTKSVSRLNEYLLISSSYSSDGEYFSVTWSTHPSLINNTITPISECRLSNINDLVAKLSNSSSGFQREEKLVIYYPISAPIVNSQAIVPTERGNYALKLSLHGPCQKTKIIEEIGITSDSEDKENNIADVHASSTSRVITTTYPPPGLPKPEAIDSNTATQATTTKAPITPNQLPSISPPVTTVATVSQTTQTKITTTSTTTTIPPIIPNAFPEDPQPIIESTTEPKLKSIVVVAGATEEVNKTTVLEQVLKSEGPLILQQPKMQPQAKSFANYLDSNDMLPSNLNMSTTVKPDIASNLTAIINIIANTTPVANEVPIKDSKSDSTLNEDFIGILNDVMEYLISVAIPLAIIIGSILLISIMIALCSLCIKRRKSKQFEVRNRFNFRYGSERRAFLKNSSKPVILDADQKSLSMGGTPQHRSSKTTPRHEQYNESNKEAVTYLPMTQLPST